MSSSTSTSPDPAEETGVVVKRESGSGEEDSCTYVEFNVAPLVARFADKLGNTRVLRKLYSTMVESGMALDTPSGVMIFVPALGFWCPLFANVTLKYVAEVIGAENATVNFDKAASGVLPFITTYAKKIAGIPRSVCFGIYRLAFNVSGEVITFSMLPAVTPTTYPEFTFFSTLCYMPVKTSHIPTRWSARVPHPYQEYLSRFLEDSNDFLSFMWVIGNALIDPPSPSKFMVLYGKGGNGKSTLINSTMEAFGASMSPISASVFHRGKVSDDDLAIAASNRVVFNADMDIGGSVLNMQSVKSLTGQDYVSVHGVAARVQPTVICGTNGLPDVVVAQEWLTPATFRRLVTVPMMADGAVAASHYKPTDPRLFIDYLACCLYVRCTFPDFVPVSPLGVVMSLLGSRYHYYEEFLLVGEEADGAPTEAMVAALHFFSRVLEMEPLDIMKLLRVMSYAAIEERGVLSVISKVALKSIPIPYDEIEARHAAHAK